MCYTWQLQIKCYWSFYLYCGYSWASLFPQPHSILSCGWSGKFYSNKTGHFVRPINSNTVGLIDMRPWHLRSGTSAKWSHLSKTLIPELVYTWLALFARTVIGWAPAGQGARWCGPLTLGVTVFASDRMATFCNLGAALKHPSGLVSNCPAFLSPMLLLLTVPFNKLWLDDSCSSSTGLHGLFKSAGIIHGHYCWAVYSAVRI